MRKFKSFGSISEKNKHRLNVSLFENELFDDKKHKTEFDIKPRKHSSWYRKELSNLSKSQFPAVHLPRMLELLDEMKRECKDKPKIYNYSPIITVCAKAGMTKKAFDLFQDGLNYFKKPSPYIVTSLVNACGECQDEEYGIKKLEWLETLLNTQYNFKWNRITNHCRIKAYGRLKKYDKAFGVLQEMIEIGLSPDTQTYNNLIYSCTSNQESGLLDAIRLYRKMKAMQFQPDIYTYNTMIHCVRFCDLGDLTMLKDNISELPMIAPADMVMKKSHKFLDNTKYKKRDLLIGQSEDAEEIELKVLSLDDSKSDGSSEDESKSSIGELTCSSKYQNNIISLLDDTLSMDIIDFQKDKLKTPWQKFKLLGGIEGFIGKIIQEGLKPDTNTFFHIAKFIPPDKRIRLKLLAFYQRFSKDKDIRFYNLLLRNICHNIFDEWRLDEAKKFIETMQANNIVPNVQTYETLAFACTSLSEASELLNDVSQSGLAISETMIINFLYSAATTNDVDYVIWIVSKCIKHSVSPNTTFVERLECFRCKLREKLLIGAVNDEKNYKKLSKMIDKYASKVEIIDN